MLICTFKLVTPSLLLRFDPEFMEGSSSSQIGIRNFGCGQGYACFLRLSSRSYPSVIAQRDGHTSGYNTNRAGNGTQVDLFASS